MKTITASLMPICALPIEDAKKFIQWIWPAREKTQFDKDTLSYPRSCMTRAEQDGETVMMVPLQPVLMFESMVRKPGLTDRQSAMCLYKIGQEVEKAMEHTGHREAYFITNDEREVHTVSRHGWTVAMHDPEKKIWLMKRKASTAAVSETTCS